MQASRLRSSQKIMKNLVSAVLMFVVATVIFGVIYPLAVTGFAQVFFPEKANGSLIKNDKNEIIGSKLIGQQFSGAGYFYSRPSAAGNGYDASGSSGSNLGPTNKKLIDRIYSDAEKLQSDNPKQTIPVDLVTTSASGLDPHISLAALEFQIPRVAKERNLSETEVRKIAEKFIEDRDFGFFGEPRVNVLLLNLELAKNK